MATKPYDKGSANDSVPALTDSGAVSYPVGAVAYGTEGGTVTIVGAAGLPVQAGSGASFPVTDGGGSLTVDGTVAVSSVSGSVAVTGTFWQATQPVSIASTVTVTGAGGTFPVTDSGGSLTVDAPVGTPVYVRLSDGTAATPTVLLSDAGGSTFSGVVSESPVVAAVLYGWSNAGQAYSAVPIESDDGMRVSPSGAIPFPVTDNGGSLTVDNAGTFAVQVSSALPAGTNAIGKLAANSGVTIGAVEIAATQTLSTVTTVGTVTTLTGGGVAHDGVDSGNPVKVGARATTSLAGLTLVANADRTDVMAGIDGVQIARPHCNLEDIVSGVQAITDGSSTSVIASQGAGVKTYITTVIIANTSATAVTVDLRDGTAGTVKATFPVPANTSGVVCNLPVPLPFSAATAVAADPSAAASTVTVTLIGFKSKV